MLNFYKKALLAMLGIIVLSLVIGYLGITWTFLRTPLMPPLSSPWSWYAETSTDKYMGGESEVVLHDSEVNFSFSFNISDKAQHPFASVAMVFDNAEGKPSLIDLSRFNTISFRTKCSPNNTLTFTLLTVDPEVTNPDDLLSYRSPATFFSCSDKWSRVELDLTRLETPQWWFDMFNLELSHQNYDLKQVPRLVFGSSFQSPKHINAQVQLHDIEVTGRDWLALYMASGIILIGWTVFGVWFFREYSVNLSKSLRDKMQKDLPLVAYQQLTVEPQRDKEKAAILKFMATEYANVDLNLDTMVKSVGISRTKINDILKLELGYTFITYLNKLRLTEAARLLTEKEDANVGEIAYSVGYKNVSYFNKLFKEEYGCTPKTFKKSMQ